MTSNSQNMNVGERLAQKLKNSELGQLLDEDSLTEISQMAIREAFFDKRLNPAYSGSYGNNSQYLEPVIVELAREQFKEHVAVVIKPLVDQMIEDKDFLVLIRNSVIQLLPEVAQGIAHSIVHQSMASGQQEIVNRLQNTIGNHLGIRI